ncbi:HNH endonuclease [Paenibacillus sp. FSL R7-0204]|uniref:HNH endonuclease signature motif containing protein n=1 Tax=Paenibacillus sp. FSL R7-0204 TaxID=2921675 RepID=UPI0030FB3B9D
MQQQVDIKRMLEQEQGLKRLNRILEEQVTGMDRSVGGQVRSVQAAYPESYVQSPSREAVRLLQELAREAQSLSDQIERKQSALRWAAGQYQAAETKAQSLLKATPAFTWKKAGSLFSRWLQGIRDQAAHGIQDVLRHPPTLSRMIQDLLRNVRDASVDRQLQSFAADAVISELFQQRESGSPAEQQQAREQLSNIAEALREIGRSQAAYSVYEKYGNKSYMKSANEHAERQRERLQKLGVDPGFYVKTDLRTQYKGSPLSACTYNPLLTDGSAVPASDELRFAIALGLVNEKYRAWSKSNYKDIEAAVIRAEQIRELERQVAEYKRLHEPPMTLPDGTPITAKNKENETTFAYFKEKVYDPRKHSEVMYTAYYGWLEDTYGMTEWRKKVVQADQVTRAFVGGLIESTVMGVVDTAKFAFDFVIDPEKTTQETIDKVNYLVNHPEVLVDAAKAMYHDFNEGTPEQKAEMLGNAASILVPGVPIAKSGMVGKLADAVMDPLTDAVKKVPDVLKNWDFPGMNPYPNRLIPATPGGPGTVEVPGQVWRSEGRGKANLKNIDEFLNGNKKFNEVIDDYAKIYKEQVDSNKPWSWDDTIPGGDSLSAAQKRKIKEIAVANGHIPEIKVTKVDGMRYGFADFAGANVVEETVELPEKFWKLSDKEQFSWLDEQIGGTRKGMTWHHTEIPGKMELVPFGIHNITPHNGGRTAGMWADAPR